MKKVLVISESNIITKSIISILEENGSEICLVETGPEAMGKLFSKKYDLIITSLFIEGIDGVQLITSVKQSQMINSLTPIILLTSGEDVEALFSTELRPDFIIQKNEKTISEFQNVLTGLEIRVNENKVKLLYIDDDKFVQKMIKMWLSKVDFIELEVCGSVAEVKELMDNEYDIIVSDNLLGDGEFSDIIKLVQSSRLKDTPIIIYTGSVAKLNFDEVKKMGNILDILPKPFEMKNFLKKVEMIRGLK